MPEQGLLFLLARCVIVLLLIGQIAVERVHAAQALLSAWAGPAGSESAI